MSNGTRALEKYVYGPVGEKRFTQDSPVLPEVWLTYAEDPRERRDLLLVPHKDSSAADLALAVRERLPDDGGHQLAYNEGYVVVKADFHQLVRDVLPLSPWWKQLWPPEGDDLVEWLRGVRRPPDEVAAVPGYEFRPDWLTWLTALLGAIQMGDRLEATDEPGPIDEPKPVDDASFRQWRRLASVGSELLADLPRPGPDDPTPLWSVALNREARTALSYSRRSVKADAAERVFGVSCKGVRWAIVDTGVDATHPAFRRRDKGALIPLPSEDFSAATRVLATYDFTLLRGILAGEHGNLPGKAGSEIRRRIEIGRAIDWEELEPLLRVDHDDDYRPPRRDHGTHVAGIVGSDWRAADGEEMPVEEDLQGICPDIELYDLRVFPESGPGDEFAVSAALQFVRHLNSHSDLQVIHGVNLSISIEHDLANYAVGRTPICDECERLTASGVVVSVAAGNEGQARYRNDKGVERDGFRTVAITDPGNAEEVITVGSTHRQNPHTYGVSYFSSRGPTGDGRAKPDLVAPGEKIKAPVPEGGYRAKDGTSQAAAHVSGVAAMLIARNPELIGQPRRIKRIICDTATDLGRERAFQGAGMIDALRALQEV